MEVLPYFYLNKKGNKLLKGNQNVELPEEYSKVGLPAHKAAFSGDVEALPLIVFALADEGVPLEDAYGASPLHLAARKNDVKVAKWLLEYTDIDLTAKAKKGETPFHVAAAQGNLKILEVMVSHDPDLKEFIATTLDDSCFTPLHLAIIRHHNHVVKYLIGKLGNRAIGSINESGINSAHVAASVGNVETLKLIYSKNKKVLHHVAKDLTTAVFFAAQEGHFNALQYLHQKGKCDLGSRSFDGMSPIHAACQNGHLEIVQYITSKLGKSATFDQTPEGSTPLHFAASNGHEDIVRWLVNNDLTGTIAFIQDNNGDTPAHDAADNGHTEILKILLENGADIHAANKDGFTPYALASQGPYEDTAAFAMKYATTSPTHDETKPSKMRIFDLENAQKEDSSLTELSPYDSMGPEKDERDEKNENEAPDPSDEKLLEWNKDEIDLFEENKTKPSHLTSLATQEYEKRTSKRQARKIPRSLKDHITQTGSTSNTNVSLFKPNMNINPLVEENGKTGVEEEPKTDVEEMYAKPDPEVVKSKSMKAKTENITAVVNEFFDEQEPSRDDREELEEEPGRDEEEPGRDEEEPGRDEEERDGELPSSSPADLTANDNSKEGINKNGELNNTPDNDSNNTPDDINNNTPDNTDMEPLITKDESSTIQKENVVSVDEDKAISDEDKDVDVQLSPTTEDAPVTEAEEDVTIQTSTVNEEQTFVTEQETVTTAIDEEPKGQAKDINGDADNVPLIGIKKSTTKTPSSPGKFGLRQGKRKDYSTFTAPNQDSQSGASNELKKAFAKYRNK